MTRGLALTRKVMHGLTTRRHSTREKKGIGRVALGQPPDHRHMGIKAGDPLHRCLTEAKFIRPCCGTKGDRGAVYNFAAIIRTIFIT